MMMMDNPEDVLQALDEFQKMRPSEIPKVLEEYLMWVAKTGEPVYQWSLIKTLFREKLLRVMNEFYESGNPSLLGPPLPNVEPFNYESMKSSLLERLENFANPPFTVQRICELLIAPRREYNRIDKYMRAVEKNILVVSTREPGSCGRRSENGDSLVNGSLEDETSHHGQTSNDVDMESMNWVKQGTSDEMTIDKTFDKQQQQQQHERLEQLSAMDATASSFVAAGATDFQVATSMPPQMPTQEVTAVVQNLAALAGEAPIVLADVDAIMNEDTSSQPSLELESDDADSNDSKKLQTIFQAKDFKVADENKSSDSESQDSKSEESLDSVESSKEIELIQSAFAEQKPECESANDLGDAIKIDILGGSVAVAPEQQQVFEKIGEVSEKSEVDSSQHSDGFQFASNDLEPIQNNTEEAASKVVAVEVADSIKDLTEANVEANSNSSKVESVIQENIQELTKSIKELPEEAYTLSAMFKPTVQERVAETTDSNNSSTKSECVELTIQETADDALKTKSIVPDPIPIVEEPKEAEPTVKPVDVEVPVLEEFSSEARGVITNFDNGLEVLPPIVSEQKEDTVVLETEAAAISSKQSTESMDVDNVGLTASAQQQEPMEQDSTEAMNS